MHKRKRLAWPAAALIGLIALFAIAATDGSAPSSKINVDSITASNYWERVTGHSWTVEKEADIDELTLERGETGDIVYTLTATRTAGEPEDERWVEGWITISNKTSTALVGVIVDVKLITQGDGPWREDALITVPLDTIEPKDTVGDTVQFFYSLPILDAGRNLYRVDVDAKIDGISESGLTHNQFSLTSERVDTLVDETATLTDVFTVLAGFGYSYDPADPVNRTWTVNQTTVIEYTCTVTNQSAAAGESFDLVNTATLVASPALTATATVKLNTPAEDPGNGEPGNGENGNGEPGNGEPVSSKPKPEKQLPSTSGGPILPFVSLAMLLSGCALIFGRKRS